MEELNSIIKEFNGTLVKKILNGEFKYIKHHVTRKKQYWTIEVDGLEFTIEIFKNKEGKKDFYIQEVDSDNLFLFDKPFNYKSMYKQITSILDSKKNQLKIKELEVQKDQLRKKLEENLAKINEMIEKLK